MESNLQLLGFCISTLYDWLKKYSHYYFIQSEVKPKPTVTRLHAVSRASCPLHVFTANFDWFIGLSVPFGIDQGGYFSLLFILN